MTNVQTRDDRFFGGEIEIREDENGVVTARGLAMPYYRSDDPGTEFEMIPGELFERVAPGAFDAIFDEPREVIALYSHDPSQILGRTSTGTFRLSKNKRGLAYEIDLPNTTQGRDLREMINRGDVAGASVGMFITASKFSKEGDREIHEITSIDLREVSLTPIPAYTSTTAAVREARDKWREEIEAARAAAEEAAKEEQREKDRIYLISKGLL